MPSERNVQDFVHRLEEGAWATKVRVAAVVIVCIAALVILIFDPLYWTPFKGLSHARGMEQAEIAREIARGHGFSTQMLRPLAIEQIFQHRENVDGSRPSAITVDRFPDTYYAPLWPATLAPFLLIVKSKWQMALNQYLFTGDQLVAAVSVLFLYLSIIVAYFTIRRLFDTKLAVLTSGLLLLCGSFWKFALSGLPQMEMLFFFSLAIYFMVRVVESRIANHSARRWLVATGAAFGLLALTHGITIWLFAGAVVFLTIYSQSRMRTALILVGVFLAVYSPWMVRNYRVCGNPLGIAPYSIMHQVRGSESLIMRTSAKQAIPSPLTFRPKVQNGIGNQFGDIFSLLGGSLVAPLFFVSLLHLFKRREVGVLRWLLVTMWLSGVVGMAFCNSDDFGVGISSDDLHVLFIPIFSAYGLAFALVMWSRLDIRLPLMRQAFIILIYAVSSISVINTFTAARKGLFWWPPYAPPYIAFLNKWTEPNEIIASDMPWAVAWYADRKSLWLPAKLDNFVEMTDFGRLTSPIIGVYLTPVAGDKPLLATILKGEYKDWAPLILRSTNVKGFPFHEVTSMPMDFQCVFYADRNRWSVSEKK